MSVLLYGALIWADAINAKEYHRTEKVSVQRKAALRYVSAYHNVSIEAVCVLAGIPPIEIVVAECKMVYRVTHRINLKSGKALQVRREERQVMLRNLEKLRQKLMEVLIQTKLKMWKKLK